MERKNNVGIYILLGLILASIIGGLIGCSFMFNNKIKKIDKNVLDLVEANEEPETQENDIVIADRYTIKSTEKISDAYKSGDDSKLSDKEKKTLTMAKKVLDEITKKDMSEYEKELAVYEWVVDNITGGNNSLLTGNDAEAVSTPYGVLRGHNAVCVGYATTFRLFMQMMDIECKVVHNTENYHSWDEVKLDGEWYYVDCYSDAGRRSYAHFNISDDTLLAGQTWDREFFPAAVGMKYNYAVQNAKPLENVYEIPKLLRKAIEDGCKPLFFNIGKDEDDKKATILNAMYQQAMNKTGEYGDVTFSMSSGENDDKILTITSYGYNSGEEEAQSALSEKEQKKLDEAMEKAFEGFSGEGMTGDSGNAAKTGEPATEE